MELIPELEKGPFNGWWILLAYFIANFVVVAFAPKGTMQRLTSMPKFSGPVQALVHVEHVLYYAPKIYAVFVPIKLGTAWFYVGIPLFVVGIAGVIVTLVNFSTTPLDEPIVKGIYRYSRHPLYVCSFLAWIGAGVALASWIILAAHVLLFVLMHYTNGIEERECLKQYGDPYRRYLETVPRYFGFRTPAPDGARND